MKTVLRVFTFNFADSQDYYAIAYRKILETQASEISISNITQARLEAAKKALAKIEQLHPDIIFLQEVGLHDYELIKTSLQGYYDFLGEKDAILALKKNLFRKEQLITDPNDHYAIAKLVHKQSDLKLHVGSIHPALCDSRTQAFAEQGNAQLLQMLNEIDHEETDFQIIAGDFNIDPDWDPKYPDSGRLIKANKGKTRLEIIEEKEYARDQNKTFTHRDHYSVCQHFENSDRIFLHKKRPSLAIWRKQLKTGFCLEDLTSNPSDHIPLFEEITIYDSEQEMQMDPCRMLESFFMSGRHKVRSAWELAHAALLFAWSVLLHPVKNYRELFKRR